MKHIRIDKQLAEYIVPNINLQPLYFELMYLYWTRYVISTHPQNG